MITLQVKVLGMLHHPNIPVYDYTSGESVRYATPPQHHRLLR